MAIGSMPIWFTLLLATFMSAFCFCEGQVYYVATAVESIVPLLANIDRYNVIVSHSSACYRMSESVASSCTVPLSRISNHVQYVQYVQYYHFMFNTNLSVRAVDPFGSDIVSLPDCLYPDVSNSLYTTPSLVKNPRLTIDLLMLFLSILCRLISISKNVLTDSLWSLTVLCCIYYDCLRSSLSRFCIMGQASYTHDVGHVLGGGPTSTWIDLPEDCVIMEGIDRKRCPTHYRYMYTRHPRGVFSDRHHMDIGNALPGTFANILALRSLRRKHLIGLVHLVDPNVIAGRMTNMEMFTMVTASQEYDQLIHYFVPIYSDKHVVEQTAPVPAATHGSQPSLDPPVTTPVSIVSEKLDCPELSECTCFPPNPISQTEIAALVNQFTDRLSTSSIQDETCGVCGRLSSLKTMAHVDKHDPLLNILCRDNAGVTRKERRSLNDPIEEIPGPILHSSVINTAHVMCCQPCAKSMRSKRIPRFSLANGNWVGDVPNCLKELTFVEKLLIAKYRHNCCVVKVTQGGRKLRCNAIVFGQPLQRAIYHLPPHSNEIAEVLAIYFTGGKGPEESTFQRTPLLVRRRFVRAALEWLILNHDDYASITLSESNLATYQENMPPVSVTVVGKSFTQSTGMELTPPEQQSIYHNPDTDDNGWNGGERCEFSVSGLSEADFNSMYYSQLTARAMRHLQDGGKVLAIGHEENPESIYGNAMLFPSMFPWLYPYGKGGFHSPLQHTKLSAAAQCQARLLYGDRRFQTDEYFMFIAFNHEQIKSATQDSLISVKRQSWSRIASNIMGADVSILDDMISKSKDNTLYNGISPAEKQWVEILREVELVASNVPGSRASKRRMRGEIRSLLMHSGVSLLYITISPCDWKNPIALYMCGERIDVLVTGTSHISYPDLQRKVAENPVACARFFHYMVTQFIEIILGFETNNTGLFGPVEAYYGTVEEQGRLTLHLHLLLWLLNHLSPQDIKERLRVKMQPFTDSLLQYLGATIGGDYITGDQQEVEDRITEERNMGVYVDPTSALAGPIDVHNLGVSMAEVDREIDRLVYLSQRHTHNSRCGGNLPNGYCKARFPREFVDKSYADDEGHVFLKKHEPNINTYSPILTYLLRTNTDVTAILSGTAVKAVLIYITDYITKSSLKTHTIFECVKSVYEKNTEILADKSDPASARRVLLKIVNALTSRQQLGGPLIAAYMLGNGDHYTNRRFLPLHWKIFADYVTAILEDLLSHSDRQSRNDLMDTEDTYINPEETVILTNIAGRISQFSRVSDWLQRPQKFEQTSLYEYFRTIRKRRYQRKNTDVQISEDDIDELAMGDDDANAIYENIGDANSNSQGLSDLPSNICHYLPSHPQCKTHYAYRVSDPDVWIVNWVGQALPRLGQGHDEYYYMTMLMLFKPWRTIIELKGSIESSWQDTFNDYAFTTKQCQLMRNFNVLYECLDARDDHAAQRRKNNTHQLLALSHFIPDDVCDLLNSVTREEELLHLTSLDGLDAEMIELATCEGPNYRQQLTDADNIRQTLFFSGWQNALMQSSHVSYEVCNGEGTLADDWRKLLVTAKERYISDKLRSMNIDLEDAHMTCVDTSKHGTWNDAAILAESELPGNGHLSETVDTNNTTSVNHQVIFNYSLNEAQTNAFTLVANHAFPSSSTGDRQLLLYIGGMGGTGKSQVIKALSDFFKRRNHPGAFAICAPTGSAACIVDGSTYHTLLKLGKGNSAKPKSDLIQRFKSISTVFLDEISMVSCIDLYNISARLCQIKGNDLPFGGVNMVFAGDFAQLPPVGAGSHPLYSSLRIDPNKPSTLQSQKAAIGKSLWQQLTHVIILRENMRLVGMSPEDHAFRTALENMRFGACTSEDVWLLKQRCRVIQFLQNDTEVGKVSLIVGRNIQRDVCNELGVEAFAAKSGVDLISFVSRDFLPQGKTMPRYLQMKLHDLRPCRTDHLAGTLRLCVGLPVMIKDNQATELCVTNGAEAIVRGWKSSIYNQRAVLDVVFVELAAPPREIQLEGLPLNVVPISPVRQAIQVKLQTDEMIGVTRQQIPLLPNFAMTDYASQGRTRPINPVDLGTCRDHKSYYTVLSRSTRLHGTFIIGDVNESKIRNGISGWLRQEFRELEILDDITRLELQGQLPSRFEGLTTRKDKLAAYRSWYGSTRLPNLAPKSLHYSVIDIPETPFDSIAWKQVNRRERRDTEKIESQGQTTLKRKYTPDDRTAANSKIPDIRNEPTEPSPKRRRTLGRRHNQPSLVGCSWDSINWSCAYDSVFTVLFHIQRIYTPLSLDRSHKRFLRRLLAAYGHLGSHQTTQSLNTLRDIERRHLNSASPHQFPFGQALAGVYNVCDHYFDHIYIHDILLNHQLTRPITSRLLVIEPLPGGNGIPHRLDLLQPDGRVKWCQIVAAIYGDGHHFTGRFSDRAVSYTYDGQNGGVLEREQLSPLSIEWATCGIREACMLFYMFDN